MKNRLALIVIATAMCALVACKSTPDTKASTEAPAPTEASTEAQVSTETEVSTEASTEAEVSTVSEVSVSSEDTDQQYWDSSGHIISGESSAYLPKSKIETGELKEIPYSASGEFYGQSGRFIQDTCTDMEVRKMVTEEANRFLHNLGIEVNCSFYIHTLEDAAGTIYYAEPINGSGLIWKYPGDDWTIAEDLYSIGIMQGDFTTAEINLLGACDEMFPIPEDGNPYYFCGYFIKNPDGSITIRNTCNGKEITMTKEELKTNAEIGYQNDAW